jgi:hypothetical protein
MKAFVTFALIVAALHCAWTVESPKVKHYFLDAKIRDMSEKGRLHNQPEMLQEILRVVEEKKIPIQAKDIRFKQDGKRIRISVAYDTTVSIPFYTKTYHFESLHSGIYDPRR